MQRGSRTATTRIPGPGRRAVPRADASFSTETLSRARQPLGAGPLILQLLQPFTLGRGRGLQNFQGRQEVPLPRGPCCGGRGGAKRAPQDPPCSPPNFNSGQCILKHVFGSVLSTRCPPKQKPRGVLTQTQARVLLVARRERGVRGQGYRGPDGCRGPLLARQAVLAQLLDPRGARLCWRRH